MNRFKFACLLMLLPAIGNAHVVLQQPTASVGAFHKAVFAVGHGCNGSATTKLTISIPDGIVGIKPMPKPGWTIETKSSPVAKPYVSEGKTINEEITEVTWSGGSLPDGYFDEFVMLVRPGKPGMHYFKVAQICEKGRHDWNQIPEQGKPMSDYPAPAPALNVLPSGSASEGHRH